MKDAREVLTEKEAALDRVRHEVDSLRIAATLLDEPVEDNEKKGSAREPLENESESQATGTDGLLSSVTNSRSSGFWKILGRGDS